MFGDWNVIISILSSLTAGGIIGSIISLRYRPKVESAKAQQEVEQVESMDISNTTSLINLYKQALDDTRDRYQKSEAELKAVIQGYEEQLKKCEEIIKSNEEEIARYKESVNQLIKSQLKFKALFHSIDPKDLDNTLNELNIDDTVND